MKGEINFELKADNIIIHAPLTLQNTLLIFLRYFLMEQTRLHIYGRKKRPGYSGKFNMVDWNGWPFCSRVRLCRFSPSERYDVPFLYFDKSELHFKGI